MDSMRAAYDEVYVYTMNRPGFILQHVVDVFAVQNATADTKAISIVFGLVGLYLHVERHFSGSQVQKVHMVLAGKKRDWPKVHLPVDRGKVTVADVLAAPAGPERDKTIDDWCRSVWTSCSGNRGLIVELLREYRVIHDVESSGN